MCQCDRDCIHCPTPHTRQTTPTTPQITEMEELRKKLAETPLVDIADAQQEDVMSLEHSQTVADALKLLAKGNILSAPLLVSPGLEDIESLEPAETSSTLVGWLDIKDIIRAFLAFLHEKRPQLPTNMLALMTELEKQGPVFADRMLITIVGSQGDRGLVYQTDAQASVLTAIRDMFLGQDGVVHRLAIFDAHGDITRIVSQTDVLRLLREHLHQLGEVTEQSLEQLGLYKPDHAAEVVRLQPNTPTLLAYKQLADAGVTGAPVVSAEGVLIANLSISDVRGIQGDHMGVLALPVAEFLAVKHNTAYLGYSQHSSSSAQHPFFASGPPRTGQRPTDADAADADAEAAAAAAMDTDGTAAAGGAAGGSPSGRSPRKSGGAGAGAHHHKGGTLRRPSSEVGLRLITCSPESTLGAVLKQLCDNHVHRVYICKENDKGQEVVGVVTPTDILSLIAGKAGWLRRTLSAKRQASGPAAAAAEAQEGDAALDAAAAAVAAAEAVAAEVAADGVVAAAEAEAGQQQAGGGDGSGGGHKKARMEAE